MAAPRSALSARISAVRSATTEPAALTSSSWSPGCLPRTCHAPIGGGTAAGGPFGQRLGPPKVMDRSQCGAQMSMRHLNSNSFLGGCERTHGPRWPDASRLDVQPVRCPRLAAVRRAVSRPGETIREDVVIPDAPQRRVCCSHAEPLVDVHLGAHAAPGAQILQPVAGLGRDELPFIEAA